MKTKMLAFFMAIVMCLGITVPAYAAGVNYSDPDLANIEFFTVPAREEGDVSNEDIPECVVLSDAQCAAFWTSQNGAVANIQNEDDANETVSPRAVISTGVGITEISAYPIVMDRNTGNLTYYPHIGKTTTYTTYAASTSLRMTATEIDNLCGEAIDCALANGEVGHAYGLVGWFIETLVQLRADTPQYVDFRIAEPNFNQGTDYTRQTVTSSFISIRISGPCQFPRDPNTTEYYHIGGVEGLFYYRINNQTQSSPFSAGIAMNVQS